MSIAYNPKIVTDGLLFLLDGANSRLPRVGDTTLTLNGGMSGPANGYYTLDGTDDSIGISSAVYNTAYTGKTVMVAARMDSNYGAPNRYRGFVGTSSGVALRNFNLYMYRDGTGFRFHFSTGNGTVNSGTFSNYLSIDLDTWFIGAVSLNSSNSVTYYLNGVAVSTTSQTFSQFNSGTNEFVGANDTRWYGDLAYVSVYGRDLSVAEIQQNYNAIRGRFGL